MTVLVTGGTGFIGAHVVRRLVSEGHKVVIYDISPNYAAIEDVKDRVKVVSGDISDLSELTETAKKHSVETIIHLAFYMMEPSENNPARAVAVNITGFQNVLEVARAMNIRVVWASSASVYESVTDEHEQPTKLKENARLDPKLVYGMCKLFNEFMAHKYYKAYGLSTLGIRISVVFGPERYYAPKLFDSSMFENAANEKTVRVRESEMDDLVDWVYVKDVAKAFSLAAERMPEGASIYNLGGEVASKKSVVKILKELVPNLNVEIDKTLSARTLLEGPTLLDWTKFRIELNFEPDFTLKDGISDFLKSLREHNK